MSSSRSPIPRQVSTAHGASNFHEFAELPLELQRQIWLIAAQDALGAGRAYQLVMTTRLISTDGEHLISGRRFSCTLSVPPGTLAATKDACASLGACSESRKAALKLAPDELVIKTPEGAPQRDEEGNYAEADLGRTMGVFHFNSRDDIIWFDEMDVDFLLGRVSTNRETMDWTNHVWKAVQNIGLGPKALRSLREGPSSPYGPGHVTEVLHPYGEPEQLFIVHLEKLRRLFVVDKVSAEELNQCDKARGWHRWLVGQSPGQHTREEPDERVANLRTQFRYLLYLQDMGMSYFKQYEKILHQFEKVEFGIVRLSDSVSDFWVENLGSDEMLDIANDTDDGDVQSTFWNDGVFTEAPTALHYIQY